VSSQRSAGYAAVAVDHRGDGTTMCASPSLWNVIDGPPTTAHAYRRRSSAAHPVLILISTIRPDDWRPGAPDNNATPARWPPLLSPSRRRRAIPSPG